MGPISITSKINVFCDCKNAIVEALFPLANNICDRIYDLTLWSLKPGFCNRRFCRCKISNPFATESQFANFITASAKFCNRLCNYKICNHFFPAVASFKKNLVFYCFQNRLGSSSKEYKLVFSCFHLITQQRENSKVREQIAGTYPRLNS